jgi:hypothetical protein
LHDIDLQSKHWQDCATEGFSNLLFLPEGNLKDILLTQFIYIDRWQCDFLGYIFF